MRFFSVFAALAVSAIVVSHAHADDLSCKMSAATRSKNCQACSIVDCGSVKGFVGNDEPVKSVIISYRTEDGQKGTVRIPSPKGSAWDFSIRAYPNDEVKAALRKKGLNPSTTASSVQLITFGGSAKIYADPDKNSLALRDGVGGESGSEICNWVGVPSLVKATGCGSPVCVGMVSCGQSEGLAACKVKGDGKSCGTAQACADDRDVSVADSTTANADGQKIKAKVGSGAGLAQ